MCRGKGSHGSVFGNNATRFAPVVYHESATGDVVIPPGNDVTPMEGYETKTASTLREVRQLTKRLDAKSAEKFYRYHQQRQQTKRRNITHELEFAQRAREKMSDQTAQRMTDLAISRMQRQLSESTPTFKPSGHFLAFENDGGRIN